MSQSARFACGHFVPEDADATVKETAPHWLCTECAIKRCHPGAVIHDWTDEERFFELRRELTRIGHKVGILEKKWAPQSEANPTLHYRWYSHAAVA